MPNDCFRTKEYFKPLELDDDEWNFGAMDRSGKFKIGDLNNFYNKIVALCHSGVKKLSLVPFNRTTKTKAIWDIDNCGSLSPHSIFKDIQRFVASFYSSEFAESLYILKNKRHEKYHIYFYKILMTKEAAQFFWSRVNSLLEDRQRKCGESAVQIIDTGIASRNGYQLRLEGFNKFNNKTLMYEADTYYHPVHPWSLEMEDIEFYQNVNLVISEEDPLTPMIAPLTINPSSLQRPRKAATKKRKKRVKPTEVENSPSTNSNSSLQHASTSISVSNPQQSRISNNRRSMNLNPLLLNDVIGRSLRASQNDNDLKEEEIDNEENLLIAQNVAGIQHPEEADNEDNAGNEHQEEAGNEAHGNIVLDHRLNERYPRGFRIMASYPVRSIQETDEGIIFNFNKSEKGRECKIADRTHSSSNCYCVLFKENNKIFFMCHSIHCKDKSLFIWKPTDFDSVETNIDDLISTTDDAICRSFKSKCRSVWCVVMIHNVLTFMWYGGQYWYLDTDKLKIRSYIANEYQASAQLDLLLMLENAKIDEKQYKECKFHLKRCLESSSKKNTIVNTLPEYMTRRHIKLDKDPFNWVFPGGVYNILQDTFRSTLPQEYVTNKQHVDWAYVAKNDLDPEKMNQLISFISHTLPDRDSQIASGCIFGTALVGIVSRDFNYNHSKEGHSGKSVQTSLLEHTGGVEEEYHYGFRADKHLLRKKQDRATFAMLDCKRFLIFEEVEEQNPLQADDIDRLTGCSSFTARHFNSKKASNQSMVTIIINANTKHGIKPWKPATQDRCIMIPYPREYVKYERDVDHENGKFLRNTKFADEDWQKEMVPYFFHYLCDFTRMWANGGKIIPYSTRLCALMEERIIDGSNFEEWIFSVITVTEKRECVLLSDIKTEYVKTDYFQGLSSIEKRQNKNNMILKKIEEVRQIKMSFKKQWKYNDNKKFNKAFVGYEWIKDEHIKLYSIESKLRLSVNVNDDDNINNGQLHDDNQDNNDNNNGENNDIHMELEEDNDDMNYEEDNNVTDALSQEIDRVRIYVNDDNEGPPLKKRRIHEI